MARCFVQWILLLDLFRRNKWLLAPEFGVNPAEFFQIQPIPGVVPWELLSLF
jgi:hypothetical protein